ncbi:MAG TPA: hypothetical protein V6C81_23325 [Planktothrix sp.]|jgi:hypothetical protein
MSISARALSGSVVLLYSFASTVQPARAEKGLLIDEEIKVFGEMKALISPIGLRVTNERLKTVIVSSAPDWKIVSFNPKTKVYFQADDVKQYRSALISSNNVFNGYNLELAPMQRTGALKVFGMSAAHYDSTPRYAATQMVAYHTGELPGSAPGAVHFDLLDQTKLPQAPCSVLEKIFGVPQMVGVPAVCWYDSVDRNKHQYLTTGKITTVTCSKKDFEFPKEYKRVPHEAQLNNMESDDFEELFRSKMTK